MLCLIFYVFFMQILGAMFIAVVVTAAENAIIREIRAARGPQPPARETAE